MFHDYPKSLYMDGATGAHVIVHDAESERHWRAKGFAMLTDPVDATPTELKRDSIIQPIEEVTKKRGRPRKED